MGLDVIEEKTLNDIISYALDYPSMVLSEVKSLPVNSNIEDFAHGMYIGYICGVFFNGFLERNKRFLDTEESSSFHSILNSRESEIQLKIKAHLKLK